MGRPAKIRREEVLAAAREAFDTGGFEGTTLADISGRLGVSPAALLRHAPTKQALFTAAMGTTPGPEMLPLAFLADVPAQADPATVLRQVAHAFVPFIQAKLRENLGRWVHFRRIAGVGRLPLPFDPAARPTPPQRNLKLLEGYLRRARRAGLVSVRNPRAAAFAFAASLHSFVMLQEVMQVLEDPMPLEEYLDTLIDVWKRGAIAKTGKRR
ncbi:MAG TPA: helix-turn-helix domain-containing protein [Thermoanaerobaculia bacterium]|nr:helix-turn-helix domain-containing protein [Thermoanaerobaculia bacterium]